VNSYRRTVTLCSPRELHEAILALLAGESLSLELDVPAIAHEAFFLQFRAPNLISPPIACVASESCDGGRQQVRAAPTAEKQVGPLLGSAFFRAANSGDQEDWMFTNLGPPPPLCDDEILRHAERGPERSRP